MTDPLPRDDHDPGHLDDLSQVDPQYGSVDVVVVEGRAAVQGLVEVSVHGPTRVSVGPTVQDVPLVLATVINPRLLLVRQVLH